ncbi:T9SS type A sorting domain-containing protein [Paracrocinitomix mangrovi]|uniref:kelch repeat-containing protein n=1 Tax=Paracrocinitomix mangrovi TaxID=2862509 RepID=UPI001C8DA0CA|nr:kelch repeat-containing protein [Paracrocinitomix mangrovi]UKN02433.1 T9SS type A sorting domain-containing protein [Paracrocinitomix mangrovi]
MIKRYFLFVGLLLISEMSTAFEVWNQKANMPATARHRTVAFTVGNKGYMGLGHYNSGPGGNTYLNDIWEYDPASNTWTQKADFAGGYRYHAVGVGYQNVAYVGTGRDQTTPPSQAYTLETDWWEFDPLANSWTTKPPIPGVGRRGAVAFLIDDIIYVGTGQVSTGYTGSFYAYDITNETWLTNIPDLPGGGRTSAVAFTIDGKGYAGTGGVGCGSNDIYEYKPSTNQWLPRQPIGGPIRNEACGFAVNGKGYILTGDNCSSGTNYGDVWEYDPNTDTWIELPEFPGTARRYMNAFVIGNKAYCGSGTSGVNFNDLWEYDQVLSTIERDQSFINISHYPNPVIDKTNFEVGNLPQGLSYEQLNIKIYNLAGQVVFESNFEQNNLIFERGNEPNGNYVYSIWYENQMVKHGKMIFI